jgi:hypothetical protein
MLMDVFSPRDVTAAKRGPPPPVREMSSTPSLSYAAFGRFGQYQKPAAGCVCCFAFGGPVMIILVRWLRQPGSQPAAL